jgi:hypothetical protein
MRKYDAAQITNIIENIENESGYFANGDEIVTKVKEHTELLNAKK